ncbi:Gfo/Idh/MocA family protein [Deinococcus hopiensis]|uniref:Predicted dehydrogenase n=1 Tax=Deinococcus hopiensis KR-140 TaxID=695939 RepID=A0A1W1UEB1_9DEIO|nr:Gfo/Idh/MocA family oxidoreductase [Deinococcus hopiensis]SMB79379.1 Predicted dehydrogenase [Deinococcus hopiensis KR-140]
MKLGLLGTAHVHAGPYVTLLREMPQVDLLGFWDDGPGAKDQAQRWNLPLYDGPQALLAARPDGVIVCSETSRHRELVEVCARAGVHVLCEKPIAPTLADSLAMRDVCEEHGVRFMTAFPMRFDPSATALRDALTRGELGDVLGVNGVNHSENPSAHAPWFADPALSGGGAVMDHVVHLADLLRWCFGREVSEVYADVQWTEGAGVGGTRLDTAGLLLLTLEDGVQASIDCSWSRPATYPRWGHLKLDVVGTEGLTVVDAFADHLTLYAPDSLRPAEWVGFGPDPNRAMLAAFVHTLQTGEPPPVSWQDGHEALRVVLAAYESAWRGQPVRLGSEATV